MSLLLAGCGGEIEPSSSSESSEPEVSSSAASSASASHSSSSLTSLSLYGSRYKENGENFELITSVFEIHFEKNEAETALVNGESYFELPAKAKFTVSIVYENLYLQDSHVDPLSGAVTNSSITFAEAVDVSTLTFENATGVGTTEVVLDYADNVKSFSFVPDVAVKLTYLKLVYGRN